MLGVWIGIEVGLGDWRLKEGRGCCLGSSYEVKIGRLICVIIFFLVVVWLLFV